MNSNFLKIIEQLGYNIYNNEDISKIRIFDKNNNELDSMFINRTKLSYITFFGQNGQKIKIYDNSIIEIEVDDNLLITAYSEYETDDIKEDGETNNVFFVNINKNNKMKNSIRIDLHKYKDGLNCIYVNGYRSINDSISPELYKIFDSKLGINQTKDGADVYISNFNKPVYSMKTCECNLEYYLNIILKHINSIGDFSTNIDIQRALSIILPSISLFIDELLVDWKKQNNIKSYRTKEDYLQGIEAIEGYIKDIEIIDERIKKMIKINGINDHNKD